ncbi:hypothetical protein AXE65_01540 [Ventosimonas gracilis]|uniref:Uncharacterized protein n=1 Tax=Ventosimonas gracilis TaxID=1680762 RepID=A0A139SVF4_9GAMM|nr:hypothetical protein AXE65_01540 [Ventosimonas gracilis]
MPATGAPQGRSCLLWGMCSFHPVLAIIGINFANENRVEPLANLSDSAAKKISKSAVASYTLVPIRAFLRDSRLYLFNLDSAMLGRIRDTSGGGERLKEIGEC